MGIDGKRRKHSTTTNKEDVVTIRKGGLVFELGIFRARKVVLYEAAINNSVVRVHIGASEHKILEDKYEKIIPHRSSVASSFKSTDEEPLINLVQKHPVKRRINGEPVEKTFCSKPHEGSISSDLHSQKHSTHLLINRKKRKCINPVANEKRYCLVMPPKQYNTSQCRLSLSFDDLKSALPTLKLPKTHWKIRIWLRNKLTTRIIITNNEEVERSITFNSKTNYFKLTVNNSVVNLLGCPKCIDSVKELEILLDIIQCIDSNDCMLQKVSER